uniref:Uncharacterized protein n=1 Tax=Alexandrium monilatum TaxID=311494 RepID=A0A7S4UWD9_9DINO
MLAPTRAMALAAAPDSCPRLQHTHKALSASPFLWAAAAHNGGVCSRGRGHGLAVATFGRRDVAGKALSFALGDDHGIHITTPADFADPSCSPPGDDVDKSVPRCPEGCAYLGSKNRQLAALADKFGVCASQMILLDDDAHNVREALRAGVMAQHTPMGLTKAVLSKVGKTIGLPASLFMPPCAL